ncbi:putative enoyl-CoA hydratase isomerase family protein [Teratosphaeria destructans]|uniref:3-hydroxyisobutyryl-CoA hydrolase n=1 Tax=Teratosphaeria destructans TaxID=418781 RepID=A0A9W7W3Y1_9PEZI|nr:putative enoyl-CoA hydratase isomerase family protein [Teratosphaeria destructans]
MLLQQSCRRLAAAPAVRPPVMPLRAKITNPAMMTARSFASATGSEIKELPGDEPHDVLFNSSYGVRTITLNRPKKLNSLNGSMARKIVPRLLEWQKSQLANVVIMKGEGRALCAGGDVAALALQNKEGKEGQQASKDYFALEYKLDHLIATYEKPYVAFMDGITMGGGVGLSLHAPFRIATENTVFAMPETNIGFFPDVGASFFLPRLDGQLGLYLALTSEQLKGVDVFFAGIATHYIDSSSLPDLEARLGELQFQDYNSLRKRLQIVNQTIEEFTTGLPHDRKLSRSTVGGNIRQAIDYALQPLNSLDDMLDALQGLSLNATGTTPPEVQDWATNTRKTILQRSPTSVAVTFRQLQEGQRWNIAHTFRKEHVIASKFMEHPDFVEGVSALLINKPKTTPNWSPPSIPEVSESALDDFFAPEPTLQLLNTGDNAAYTDYPHAWTSLPSDLMIQEFVQRGRQRRQKVVEEFIQRYNGKQGVQEKVEDVMLRKCVEGRDGNLAWKS